MPEAEELGYNTPSELKKGPITPVKLRCEYLENPLGIDMAQPRFSWRLESSERGEYQTAYQILVASTLENLNGNNGDKWDSGKVESNVSVNVAYEGEKLKSSEICYWKVRVWNKGDDSGPWSNPANFEMGLLKKDEWKGVWIGSKDKNISAPLLRKEFTINKKIKRARAHVSGLGYCELYIDGEKVGDYVLNPGTTYYNSDQDFDLHDRVLYVTFDVTDLLKIGRNAVGVMLGNGWYSSDEKCVCWIGRQPYGDRPKLILQINIEFTTGGCTSIVTDNTWKASGGPIIYNDICNGEIYDARLEKPGWNTPDYDDSDWDNAEFVEPPGGELDSQLIPPIKVIETIEPVEVLRPKWQYGGVYVYDFGQHFTGWVRLRVSGPKGARVALKYAGRLYDDNTVDQRNNLGARQTDIYILKGEGTEIWEPRFTLHGFRYVEMTGFPGTPSKENLEGQVVHSAIETSGSFTSSNPLLNQIHHNVVWTFRSSFQSIPQDAADRCERVGWLGDPGFVAEDYIYNFDTASFWTKWLNDIKDSQKPNGDVPVVSPIHWRGPNWNPYSLYPAWKSTYPLFVWYVYWYYDDKRILEEHYDGIKKLVGFLNTLANDNIISCGLGDHMEPQDDGFSSAWPRHTPVPLTSTAYYYYDAWILSQLAEILGKTDEAKYYSDLAKNIKDAFNREFLDKHTDRYGTGSQTSNALSLYLGMVPEEAENAIAKNLVEDIMKTHNGHLSTGIIGTNALQQALPKYGRADVMYIVANQTTFPSWGYTISKGATTIWECFEGGNLSLNMKMFGSIEVFFYKYLAGISPASHGFKEISIKPHIVGDLKSVSASVGTVRGLISSSWIRGSDSLRLDVTVPVNCRAEVSTPKIGLENVTIKESGKTVWIDSSYVRGVAGITSGNESVNHVTFDVGSGSYSFELSASLEACNGVSYLEDLKKGLLYY